MIATPPRSCARWRACASAASRSAGGAAPWACPPSTGGAPGHAASPRRPRPARAAGPDRRQPLCLARGPRARHDAARRHRRCDRHRPRPALPPHGGSARLRRRLPAAVHHYGLPARLYGDRINILVRNDPHWSLDEQLRGAQDPTHLGRVLHDLGIGYIAARLARSQRPRRTPLAHPAGSPDQRTPPAPHHHPRGGQRLSARVPRGLQSALHAAPADPAPAWRAAPRDLPSSSAVATRARWPATTPSASGPAGSSCPAAAPTPAVASSCGSSSMAASSSCMRAPSSPRSRRRRRSSSGRASDPTNERQRRRRTARRPLPPAPSAPAPLPRASRRPAPTHPWRHAVPYARSRRGMTFSRNS